ncbi:hypothetical protein HYH02_004475 [Chlamydomonas schloesseri]|uniref:Protein kinase domain-containing protein n=1 Tax=Chlamydomonas schloesseri TaxID=2026947 RepID=A0A836B8K4_9CHLO|nr:hypothetical protein HYH02_004475 [Chlamydomonas schloesseri]|eukprot:KAG2450635.1 hypothetical protein HYH02_004475 [Chlamydomonas schloesseri]
MTLECTKQYGIVGCYNYLALAQRHVRGGQLQTNASRVSDTIPFVASSPLVATPSAAAGRDSPQGTILSAGGGGDLATAVPAGSYTGASSSSSNSSDSGNTEAVAVVVGAVAGGVVGGLGLVAGVAWAIMLVHRRCQQKTAAAAANGGAGADSGADGDSESGSWGKGSCGAIPQQGLKAANGSSSCKDEDGQQYSHDSSGHAQASSSNAAGGDHSHHLMPQQPAAAAAASWSLVPVTRLTPLQPHIPLNVTTVVLAATTTAGSSRARSGGEGYDEEFASSAINSLDNAGLAGSNCMGMHGGGIPAAAAAAAAAGAVVAEAVAAHAAASGAGGRDFDAAAVPSAAAGDDVLHVVLTGHVIGRGSFGKVVEGIYNGRRVAVKLVDMGLLQLPLPPPLPPPPPQQQQQQQTVSPALHHIATQPPYAAEQVPMSQEQYLTLVDSSGSNAMQPPYAAEQVPMSQEQYLTLVDSSGSNAMQPPYAAEQVPMSQEQYLTLQQAAAEAHYFCPQQQQQQRSGRNSSKAQNVFIATLEQEVQVLARVQHANIVSLLAANLTPPNVCLVMERLDTSLDRLLYKDPNRRPLSLSLIIHIALQVARALAHLHPTICHRDIKPGNVLISNADASDERQVVVKLADFGFSRLRSSTLITQEPGVGTGPYMAPECFDTAHPLIAITDRADCYSFGVLLWELLARRQPWAELNLVAMAVRVVVNGDRLPMSELVEAGAPVKLQKLVKQCFEPDPRRRPAAADIVKVLLLVQEQLEMGVCDGACDE